MSLIEYTRKCFKLARKHQGIVDGWWNGLDGNERRKFIEVAKPTEKRFLEQKDLIIAIENSKDVKVLEVNADKVREIIKNGDLSNFNYEFLPKGKVDDIPIEWFKAAEIAIKEQKGILNANTVKLLAADVWRQGIVRLDIVKNKK